MIRGTIEGNRIKAQLEFDSSSVHQTDSHSVMSVSGSLQSHQFQLVSKPPQFGIDSLDLLDMSPGPSSVLRVRCYRACFAFRCSWSGALAAVQPTPGLSLECSLLAGSAPTCLGKASPARPVDPETRFAARFDKIFVVSFCHCSFRPFMRLGVQSSLWVAV